MTMKLIIMKIIPSNPENGVLIKISWNLVRDFYIPHLNISG
jgi:hypothetical protein